MIALAQAVPPGAAASDDTATQLLHLAFLVAMIALLVGGFVLVTVLWYVRGRDPHTGMVAEYIPEPPDDLPPGAAGTLLDERADHEDVVATMLGLARHGAIQIHEKVRPEGSTGKQSIYEIEVLDPMKTGSKLEHDLLAALFDGNPQAGDTALLSEVKGRFDAWEPRIKHDLYQELVDRKYFNRSPEETRQRWRRLAWAGLILSPIIGFIMFLMTDGWAFLPAIAAMIVWFALLRMSRNMPQKSFHGAESAARWRAFRTYLRSIEKYESLEESRALFDRYLPYAVAFGMQQRWIATFAAAGTTTPTWLDASLGDGMGWGMAETVLDGMRTAAWMGHLSGGGGGAGLGDVNVPDVDLPNVGMPDMGNVDLSGMAEGLGGGLEAASSGLGGLLEAAGGIFDSIDFDW
ncbi:MAG TPA: DUF2207 domain-containing protein [Thermomicrobiales bacterium]|nr:DUF2207 domain-containing protein [Thermomicrobiales bacterium]